MGINRGTDIEYYGVRCEVLESAKYRGTASEYYSVYFEGLGSVI